MLTPTNTKIATTVLLLEARRMQMAMMTIPMFVSYVQQWHVIML